MTALFIIIAGTACFFLARAPREVLVGASDVSDAPASPLWADTLEDGLSWLRPVLWAAPFAWLGAFGLMAAFPAHALAALGAALLGVLPFVGAFAVLGAVLFSLGSRVGRDAGHAPTQLALSTLSALTYGFAISVVWRVAVEPLIA